MGLLSEDVLKQSVADRLRLALIGPFMKAQGRVGVDFQNFCKACFCRNKQINAADSKSGKTGDLSRKLEKNGGNFFKRYGFYSTSGLEVR